MLLKETIRSIVKAQQEELASFELGIEREGTEGINLDLPFATIIAGVRRCGKSTLMRQMIKREKAPYYFNFEDPRAVDFEVSDFNKLEEVFHEEFGRGRLYFFDEIQNVPRWEHFIRKGLGQKKYFMITGSNASLLSRELGTKLTGRHLDHELFPFSFREFLKFTKKKANGASFSEYFRKGGFPEYLKFGKKEILHELFKDVVVRDIAARHNIRSLKTIKELALYLFTNVGKEFSYNGLKKTFDLGSANSAISFISYLEDSYLLFTVPKFDYSLKKQQVNPKKIYVVDNGLCNTNSLSFSSDDGRMLENLVFTSLRRKSNEIFYFKGKGECDFVVREKGQVTAAYQICYELNEDNKGRELTGLIECLEKLGLKEGMLLTYDQKDDVKMGGKTIHIVPVWEWLLR